jgi:hypothetical protein
VKENRKARKTLQRETRTEMSTGRVWDEEKGPKNLKDRLIKSDLHEIVSTERFD